MANYLEMSIFRGPARLYGIDIFRTMFSIQLEKIHQFHLFLIDSIICSE